VPADRLQDFLALFNSIVDYDEASDTWRRNVNHQIESDEATGFFSPALTSMPATAMPPAIPGVLATAMPDLRLGQSGTPMPQYHGARSANGSRSTSEPTVSSRNHNVFDLRLSLKRGNTQ
jgi:hypothetical protein